MASIRGPKMRDSKMRITIGKSISVAPNLPAVAGEAPLLPDRKAPPRPKDGPGLGDPNTPSNKKPENKKSCPPKKKNRRQNIEICKSSETRVAEVSRRSERSSRGKQAFEVSALNCSGAGLYLIVRGCPRINKDFRVAPSTML